MEEAAKQRQIRLERRSVTALKDMGSSSVSFIQRVPSMVKVSASSMFKEDEMRAFFEAAANEVAGSEAEYSITTASTRIAAAAASRCRQILSMKRNSKEQMRRSL